MAFFNSCNFLSFCCSSLYAANLYKYKFFCDVFIIEPIKQVIDIIVYLQSNSASSKAKVNQSQKKESCDRSIKKQKNPQLQRNKTEIFDRNETFTKSDRKRITEKLAGNNKYGYSGHGKDRQNQKSTTNFREVADRKMKSEGCCSILPPSQRDSPPSWYIPSDPPSRSQSISLHTRAAHRQNSVEDETVTAARPSRHSFGWSGQVSRGTRTQGRSSHQHQQATQTGNSLLRMYMKKVCSIHLCPVLLED